MNALWTILFLAGSSLPLVAQVSKEEVRRLIDAHVSDQTILAYVQKNGPMEPLSIDDLADLKNAGASDNLLKALLDASRPSSSVTPPPATTDSYPYQSPSTTYDSTTYYYYYPYYTPYTIYPSFYYSYARPYRSYPYRYSYSYPTYRSYPYSSYYGYGRNSYYPYTTVPRTPVQPGGVRPYRQPQTTHPQQPMTPRTTAPPAPTRPATPPHQAPSTPRGHGPYR